jgi:predicted GNAT family N-acyltransferase
MNPELEVRPIEAAQTVPLRSEVLRPGRPIESAIFPGDDDPKNRHFGVFKANELVGVASLFRSPLPEANRRLSDEPGGAEWQLRGMAIEPSTQKSGLGRALLRGCIEFVARTPGSVLWCNARSEAIGFYRNNGFETRGEEFVIPDVGPHFVMVYNPTK